MNRGEQEVYRVRTHSVMEHTEQHRLEQLEHSRVQEEQAGRSHWEHVVLDPWFLWHTQQEAGAAATPTTGKATWGLESHFFQVSEGIKICDNADICWYSVKSNLFYYWSTVILRPLLYKCTLVLDFVFYWRVLCNAKVIIDCWHLFAEVTFCSVSGLTRATLNSMRNSSKQRGELQGLT